MISLLDQACEWAASLRLADIPTDVRQLAVAQALSAAGARAATRRHPVSARLVGAVEGSGWAELAASDALLTMALDFDETAFAGHLGHATVSVALRAAAASGADGETALTAMVAASEIAARLTASVTLGRARGQTASHTHAVATVVAAAVVFDLTAAQMATALSLALAQPRQVLLPAFMASDAKFWVAAAAILDGARAVAQARRGASGLTSVLQAPGGVLDTLADVPLLQAFAGYGERWHLRSLSIKAVPGCAYLGAAVEAAAQLGPLDLAEIESITVAASIFTVGMEAESAPYIAGPSSPLPALAFSTGHNVAAALGGATLDVDDLYGDRLANPERWRVAALLHVEHDPALTLAALSATAPVGAALAWAGDAALPYLTAHGATPDLARVVLKHATRNNDPDLASPSKRVGARLRATLRDGTVLEADREAAAGSCQSPVADRFEVAAAKLRTQAGWLGHDGAAAVAQYRRFEELSVREVRALAESG